MGYNSIVYGFCPVSSYKYRGWFRTGNEDGRGIARRRHSRIAHFNFASVSLSGLLRDLLLLFLLFLMSYELSADSSNYVGFP